MRVAYLTSADMVPGAPGARADLFELELQWAALQPACAARGLHLELRVWDDPALAAADYDAVVVGTTWDYQGRAEAFLARLDALAEQVPVLNPPAVLRWNVRKDYLRDLAAAGVPTVPTVWAERVDEETVGLAFETLGCEALVAKALVGACAERQVKVRRGQGLPPAAVRPPDRALLQPYLPAVASEGELSFVFCGGELSHALRKRPAAGDYRVQSIYGGREEPAQPTAAEIAGARAVLAAVPGGADLLYARVDQVRGADGTLLLMELELIEPYLYPEQGPELGLRFAAALGRMLGT